MAHKYCISLRAGVIITSFIHMGLLGFMFWGIFQNLVESIIVQAPGTASTIAWDVIVLVVIFGTCLLQIIGSIKNHARLLRWSFYLGVTIVTLHIGLRILYLVVMLYNVNKLQSSEEFKFNVTQYLIIFAVFWILCFAFEIFNLVLLRALYLKPQEQSPKLHVNEKV